MTSWKLAGNSARWADSSAVISFNQTAPGNGLDVFTPLVLTEPMLQLFAARFHNGGSSALGEASQVGYCAASIHVTFAESDHLHWETRVAWRIDKTDAEYTSIDVVVSIGTQLPKTFAKLSLCSRVKFSEILMPRNSVLDRTGHWIHVDPVNHGATAKGIPCALFRLPGSELSYLEMIHPSDLCFREICCEPDSEHAVIRHQLFSCSLERGVILRARLRGILLPRDSDCSSAASAFAQFAAADPPLGR